MTPFVSIVVPSHNRVALLMRTLRSVLAQRDVSLEVIVVDDGSTDKTSAAAACADRRVIVLRNETSAGVSAARNRGVAAARGSWIAFCDDDDLWAPEKLAAQISAAERAGTGWVYGGDVNIDDELRILSGGPPPAPDAVVALMPRGNPLSSGGSNVVVRANLLAAVGGFKPSLHRSEDWDLWIRLARCSAPACVSEPVVAYRFHAGNVTSDPADMVAEARWIAREYGIAVDMQAMHRRAAWAALRAGRRLRALQYYARAVAAGDLRSVARGAVALVHPAVGSDRLFDLLPKDREWIAKAERWLRSLRQDARKDHPVGLRD